MGASNSFLGHLTPLLSQLVSGCQHVNLMPFRFVGPATNHELEAISYVQESQNMAGYVVCNLLGTSLGCIRAKDLDLLPSVKYFVML